MNSASAKARMAWTPLNCEPIATIIASAAAAPLNAVYLLGLLIPDESPRPKRSTFTTTARRTIHRKTRKNQAGPSQIPMTREAAAQRKMALHTGLTDDLASLPLVLTRPFQHGDRSRPS